MNILDIVILVFIILETLNVLILYFNPNFKYGNGVSVFKRYKYFEKDEKSKLFVDYMAKWVANSKIIFITLLIVILIKADDTTKLYAAIFMALAISAYYLHMHPIIKKLDNMGEIEPKGYSNTLFSTITIFIIALAFSALAYVFLYT